jgi:signal transduction histidine kinase
MTRRLPWPLLIAAVLLVLLATLATLQYRWLGEVSAAERERMRAGLRTRTSDFTKEFDSQLTRTYVAFHVDNEQIESDPASALADAYARWRASSATPELVTGVYLAEGQTFQTAQIRRLDPDRNALDPVEWPPALAASMTRVHQFVPQVTGAPPPFLMGADAIDSRTPALIVAVPRMKRIGNGRQFTVMPDPTLLARLVIAVLDAGRLQHEILEPLVTKYFGDGGTSEYLVTIVRRDEPSTVIYTSDNATTVDAAAADVTSGLFDLRMDELNRLADAPGPRARTLGEQRLAITIVRRANGGEGRRVLMAGGDDQGAWQVRVRYRSGSLDAIVGQSRRRNLAISLGVLGLLGASVVLIIAAAQRQQRLARQQMEFVAAVSHELRTPLAVICSAGENLADGVVADDPQVRRYGSLIQSEGRRLRDMVERVLEFAGITSGAPPRPFTDVDLARVIAGVVGAIDADARDRGVAIHVHTNGSLPAVAGDADALRSAVQNVVGNAVKYSAPGSTVDVSAAVQGSTVQIRVVDRGLGIHADDLPYVFKPFHRGRRAVEAQVRGTGVGLSVVRQVIDAHRGDVRIESRPGEGTTVIVDLPVASPDLTASHSEKVSDTSDTSDTAP